MEKSFTLTFNELLDVLREHFAKKYSLKPLNVEIIADELRNEINQDDYLFEEVVRIRLNPIILDDFSNVKNGRFANLGNRLCTAKGKVSPDLDGFSEFAAYRQMVQECYELWDRFTMNDNTSQKINQILDNLKNGVVPNLKIDIKNNPKLNGMIFFESEWDEMLAKM